MNARYPAAMIAALVYPCILPLVPAMAQLPLPVDDDPAQVTNAPSAEDGLIESYLPADFERFAPNSALDMARQIPGFVIDRADQKRGLGQGGANVLVNGRRISGKSNDAVDELSRIAAADVVRLDIVEGASLDVPGLSGQVLNVIRNSSGISGQFQYGARVRTDSVEAQLADIEISVSGGSDALSWTIGLENDQFRGGEFGPERVTDSTGALIDIRDEDALFFGDAPQLSGSLRHIGSGGNVLNLNGLIGADFFRLRERGRITGPGQPDRDRRFSEDEDEFTYEVGADYEFPLLAGRLKLIALRSYEDSPRTNRIDTRFADARPPGGSRFARDADETETIARGEYSWSKAKADWQLSLEGAVNSLDIESEFADRDADGVLQNIDFPGATASVTEKRAETGLSYGRPLSAALTLQSSLGGEYSRIEQSGPLGQTRSFVRPKGFVSLAWQAASGFDVSAKLEREVGQLDFFDFIASVNINNDTVNVSNADLVPSQSWNSEIEVTKTLGGYGSVTARGYYQAISDIVDQVPVGVTGEAPGNIDSAKRYGMAWNSTFLGDPFGWTGARLDIELQLQKSRVDDPLTGQSRSLSGDLQRSLEMDFRYDIPRTDWAVSAFWENEREAPQVRLDSIFEYYESPGYIQVSAEHKDVFGLTVKGSVGNIGDSTKRSTRTVFEGRRTDQLAFIETRTRSFGTIFRLDVSGSF